MKLSTKVRLTELVGGVEWGIAITMWILSWVAPTTILFLFGILFGLLFAVMGFIFIRYPEYVTNKILNIQTKGGV